MVYAAQRLCRHPWYLLLSQAVLRPEVLGCLWSGLPLEVMLMSEAHATTRAKVDILACNNRKLY